MDICLLKRVFSIPLVLISMLFAEVGYCAESQIVTFGIVPQQSATRLAKQWTPLLRYISDKTGLKVIFKTARDIPAFEERVVNGEYDIAYMNPYHYTVFSQYPGYVAIAREKDKKIQGIIVVQKESLIQDIAELDGMSLAFPAPAAFAASVLPRASFIQQGIDITPVYVSSHDSVYLSVSKGIFPAGGGVLRTLDSMPEDVQGKLRILWKTAEFTPHAFAVHPRVPEKTRDLLQQAFVHIADEPEGVELLAAINFKGLQAAVDSDWDDVRALGITMLTNLKKE
jgi:phosphonate transport system substrate-binding protein